MSKCGSHVLGFILALSVAAPTPLHAQTASVAPLADALTGEAKQAYEAAKLVFADGDFKGALNKFSRAYKLSREPRLLWNMAACEKELRHYASAAQLVQRYLSEGGSKLNQESRDNASSTLQALRSFYSELTLETVPTGATVSIDGVRAATAPLQGPLFVDLGTRRLRIELDGFEPFERHVEIAGAEAMKLEVTLTPSARLASLTVTSDRAGDLIGIDG